MSALLCKPPAVFDVYNDLDQDVVTFFRVLRDRCDELVRAIQLTPFSRAELARAYEPTDDELERARRLYTRAYQSIGGPRTKWNSGWRFQKTDSRGKRSIDDWDDLDHLYAVAERLRGIYIECDDALAIVNRYDTPETLFYCDPPYLPQTRSERWAEKAYTHEMTHEQHRELARALQDIQGMAIVSGYPSELYDELYQGWPTECKKSRTNTIRNGGSLATEKLWISCRAFERLRQPRLLNP